MATSGGNRIARKLMYRSSSGSKGWSDAARAASIESRRRHATGNRGGVKIGYTRSSSDPMGPRTVGINTSARMADKRGAASGNAGGTPHRGVSNVKGHTWYPKQGGGKRVRYKY